MTESVLVLVEPVLADSDSFSRPCSVASYANETGREIQFKGPLPISSMGYSAHWFVKSVSQLILDTDKRINIWHF